MWAGGHVHGLPRALLEARAGHGLTVLKGLTSQPNSPMGLAPQLPNERPQPCKVGLLMGELLSQDRAMSRRDPVPSICREGGGLSATAPTGTPSVITHRFLHRRYAHCYPQAVRDLSQAPSQRSCTPVSGQAHLLNRYFSCLRSALREIGRWRRRWTME